MPRAEQQLDTPDNPAQRTSRRFRSMPGSVPCSGFNMLSGGKKVRRHAFLATLPRPEPRRRHHHHAAVNRRRHDCPPQPPKTRCEPEASLQLQVYGKQPSPEVFRLCTIAYADSKANPLKPRDSAQAPTARHIPAQVGRRTEQQLGATVGLGSNPCKVSRAESPTQNALPGKPATWTHTFINFC